MSAKITDVFGSFQKGLCKYHLYEELFTPKEIHIAIKIWIQYTGVKPTHRNKYGWISISWHKFEHQKSSQAYRIKENKKKELQQGAALQRTKLQKFHKHILTLQRTKIPTLLTTLQIPNHMQELDLIRLQIRFLFSTTLSAFGSFPFRSLDWNLN